jgi:hypothetical protein
VHDAIKSILSVTLLAMLGGFTVAVTSTVVRVREPVEGATLSPVPRPAHVLFTDPVPQRENARDSNSVKGTQ